MHTIREITRLATMFAGLIAPRLRLGCVAASSRLRIGYTPTTPHLRLDYALASISCEHCRSSRNNPHCAPRHVIYYFVPLLVYLILSIEISKNTGLWDFRMWFRRFLGNAVLWYVFKGMPTSPQKYYFQILGNPQKLECVFFICATARIWGWRLKFLLFFLDFEKFANQV